MNSHPSFFALDRATLGSDEVDAHRDHVDSCDRCRAHVERLLRPDPVPAWVVELRPPRARPTWRWWGSGLALAGAVAALLFVVLHDRRDRDAFTTVKGSATVVVHVKRGDEVFVWDGVAPIQPGDRLRLEVAPGGHRHVQVFTSARVSLYDAPLPTQAGPTLLPKAWQVDDQPGAETLIVVLSDDPVSADSLDRAPDDRVWRTTLILNKTTPEEP